MTYFDDAPRNTRLDDEELDYAASRFADPGGKSALHSGARIHPCPTCEEPGRLTARDIQSGYQCDQCADQAEFGY